MAVGEGLTVVGEPVGDGPVGDAPVGEGSGDVVSVGCGDGEGVGLWVCVGDWPPPGDGGAVDGGRTHSHSNVTAMNTTPITAVDTLGRLARTIAGNLMFGRHITPCPSTRRC